MYVLENFKCDFKFHIDKRVKHKDNLLLKF